MHHVSVFYKNMINMQDEELEYQRLIHHSGHDAGEQTWLDIIFSFSWAMRDVRSKHFNITQRYYYSSEVI